MKSSGGKEGLDLESGTVLEHALENVEFVVEPRTIRSGRIQRC